MFRHYLQIAVRNLKRQKGYSFINVVGLALGLAICIFILLYVQYELSYDSHHKDTDRIYRIVPVVEGPAFSTTYGGIAPYYARLIKGTLAQVEYMTWAWMHNVDSQVEFGDKIFKEKSKHVMFVDENFLNLFSAVFVYGNPETAFMNPNSALITVEAAKKYFSEENALDQVITVDDVAYRITGIIEEPPGNSIFKYRILKSWKVMEDFSEPTKQSAGYGGYYETFVKLHPGADISELEHQIADIMVEQNKDYLTQMQADVAVTLQPIRDIHFYPDIQFDLPAPGNILYIYLFSCIAFFILIITAINFINLSTARAASRAGEVGIRKTVGAQRRQLIAQFMGESFFTTGISYLIALILVNILIPPFNALTSLKVEYSTLLRQEILLGLVLLFVIVGIAAGIYPSAYLSSFKPVSVLKGTLKMGTKSGKPRRILVVTQFSMSSILIIVAIVFNLQLYYMKHKPLGFEKEQIMIIDFQRNYRTDLFSVKNEFLKHPSVTGASFSSSIPGKWLYPWNIWPSGQRETNTRPVNCMGVDRDFLTLYKIDLIAGKKSNGPRSLIFNERAVRAFGWDAPEDALNKKFKGTLDKAEDWWEVIGVMKDFHYTGLQKTIEPAAFFLTPSGIFLSLKIDTVNMREALAYVRQTYRSLFPGKYLEYYFLDDDFNRHYLKEERMKDIFNVFTVLAMFIACLGIFGLSAFTISQKTKEIGIRKILGASSIRITTMLTNEFIRWVAISNIIGWPVALIIVKKILRNFAYRVDLGMGPFLLTVLVTTLIALLSVSYQSIKAALANPVDSLRSE